MNMSIQEARKEAFLEMASHFETWDETTQDKALEALSKYSDNNIYMSLQERAELEASLDKSDEGNCASEEEMKEFFKRVTQ